MNIFLILTVFMISTLHAIDNEDLPKTTFSIENGLRPKVLIVGETLARANILERMKHYKVPGVSIALINNGKVEWSKGYGRTTNDPKSARIDEHTLFQAGSISKPVAAFGALLLVQQGKISLDVDVNVYLKRWKVPESDFTKSEKVTLRRLLSHTAGTSISGFPGYSIQNPTPKITEILKGEKPNANTDPVIVISTPGTELKYSGGGTTIVQLLIEDVTGKSFDIWMKKNVLDPLGMFESTFTQPLPSEHTMHAAYGHYASGESVKGNWHVYPEMAAAGLWTTARDLGHFMTYIQRALKNENPTVLNNFYVKEMISRQKINGKEIDAGLGFFLNNGGEDLVFTHGGQDEGFISRLYGYAFRGQGAIIMINNDSAWGLMDEITNSIADTYRWPYFNPIERKVTHIDPFGFANLVGEYIKDEEIYKITLSNNQLFVDFKKGYGPVRLWSSAICKFFIQEEDLTIDFLNYEENNNQLSVTDSKGVKTFFKKK